MRESSYHQARLAEAAAKFLEARQSRARDLESRRAYAAAESEFAEQLSRGRYIDDSGRQFTYQTGGRVRMRQLNTEPRTPGRRSIAIARRHGYEGTDDELRATGRQIRRLLRSLDKTAVEVLLQDAQEREAQLLAELDDDDIEGGPEPSPAATRTTSSDPSSKTGWVGDRFVLSKSQARDPAFMAAHQQDLVKAGFKNLDMID